MSDSLKYKIALSLIPSIGDVLAKRLVAYCGNVEAVFKEKKATLEKIPGIGTVNATAVINHTVFNRAEEEILFIEKNSHLPVLHS
jgi:DNA processing protein